MDAASPAFVTTCWSVVIAAGDASRPDTVNALEKLCREYWYPLYAFLRRLGHSPADAEDLAQGFFAYLLANELVSKADRTMGRFRTFLLGCLQRWLSNQSQRDHAARRGGGARPVSLDSLQAEERYALEPRTDETPASHYERTWAETLIGETVRRLQAEFAAVGQCARFEALQPALLGSNSAVRYAEIAAATGLDEGAVKVAVHRLRKRFGQILRATVADTVADPAEADAELRYLLRIIAR